jgi:hypothetical protein
MKNGTAYLMIFTAVQQQQGLIHGRLRDSTGASCAIGSYFNMNHQTSLPNALIDEVAAVNDSVPQYSRAKRRHHVLRWLRWKLAQLNMPGYRNTPKKKAKASPRA